MKFKEGYKKFVNVLNQMWAEHDNMAEGLREIRKIAKRQSKLRDGDMVLDRIVTLADNALEP
jgi:hypothetical protein